ncbi:hypothetical protein M422DRAFT_258374 [Sphaerobolus stellatus SS14]|uniref:ABC transmembrane type-1 domain-containing protein n=1 Tax=Sphaerobolus stellatus (strain SS14) TaxID=990650 RepID=A0A0C9UVS4_SPHS4|nr:hypothetical protein M422DRAFT_258374 [Sphaerobolus stellatus SS14]
MEQVMQTILGQASIISSPLCRHWLTDTLLIPLYASAASCVILCVHFIVLLTLSRKRKPSNTVKVTNGDLQPQLSGTLQHILNKLNKYMNGFGGFEIFSYMFARMIGCFALFGLALHTLISTQDDEAIEYPASKPYAWVKLAIPATYLYCSLLCVVSLSCSSLRRMTRNHAIGVLSATFAVYAYRDIWPLATNNQHPIDASDKLLWTKLGLLTVISVVIPLVIPRQYVPVDSKEPMPEPNPELTVSWLSMLTYIYMNPIVFAAAKVSHLTPDKLPPLSDTDWAKYLKKRTFSILDVFQGAKKRHLFFRLMHPTVFGKDYVILAVAIIIQVIGGFLAPTAVNRILFYLENDKPEMDIKPWFWITFLFIGPMLNSVCNQWYIFVGTRVLVRATALLTQLIFEHSLRIRMKAEVEKDDGKGKGKDDDAKDSEKSKKGGAHLTGKINNLLTSDLEHIGDGRDFLLVVLTVPLQLILCVVWLYQVLGWSSFVGLATIIGLFPIPGWIAKKVQSIQKNKMKKSDARVQEVTDAISVIRMIKLFGWEGEVNRRIAEKREEELRWIWYMKLVQMSNGALNVIITNFTMLTTYATYTLIMHEELNASKVHQSFKAKYPLTV